MSNIPNAGQAPAYAYIQESLHRSCHLKPSQEHVVHGIPEASTNSTHLALLSRLGLYFSSCSSTSPHTSSSLTRFGKSQFESFATPLVLTSQVMSNTPDTIMSNQDTTATMPHLTDDFLRNMFAQFMQLQLSCFKI